MSRALTVGLCAILAVTASAMTAESDPLPPDTTYRPLPTMPFSRVREIDEAQKPQVNERQRSMLDERYDLSDRPMQGVLMSGGRKSVQEGVRVKLPEGQTWESLAEMTPAEIREKDLLPDGFKPLPHPKQANGGQVFPETRSRRSPNRSSVISGASTSTSICPTT